MSENNTSVKIPIDWIRGSFRIFNFLSNKTIYGFSIDLSKKINGIIASALLTSKFKAKITSQETILKIPTINSFTEKAVFITFSIPPSSASLIIDSLKPKAIIVSTNEIGIKIELIKPNWEGFKINAAKNDLLILNTWIKSCKNPKKEIFTKAFFTTMCKREYYLT